MRVYNDLSGKVFGRLTVIKRHGVNRHKNVIWECKCICGNAKNIVSQSLTRGLTMSCGCLQKDSTIEAHTTHKLSKTAEHSIWLAMKSRCSNKNIKEYKWYGARGIRVCDKWVNSFESFLSDMGPRPSNKHSIDRIDPNKGYENGNCRWATTKEQADNRRSCLTVTHNGVTDNLANICQSLGIKYRSVYSRLYTLGWTLERALQTPMRHRAIALFVLFSLLSFTAYGQTAKYATTVPQPDQLWSLAKDSITWLEAKGQVILHIEVIDTATYDYFLYKRKKKWVVTPTVIQPVKVEAESFVTKVNAEISGTFVRPTSGWLPWSVNYNVTLTGQNKVSFTYFNGNTGDCIVTLMAGATKLGSLPLPTSGGWSNSRTEIFSIPAQTGAKSISLSFPIGINFDYFTFSK